MTNPIAATRLRYRTPAAYSAVVLADAPLAYWRMEDAFAAATAADSSGNGRTMTLNNTRSLQAGSRNSRLGRGVAFPTAAGYGSVASAAWHQITGDMTMELWVCVHSAATTVLTLMSDTASGAGSAFNRLYQWALLTVSTVKGVGVYHESGSQVQGANTYTPWTWTPGRWHHLVCVRDTVAQTYTFYADGVLLSAQAYASNPTGGTSVEFNINRVAEGNQQIGAASFDEVAIYNTKLSAARIFEHYRAGRRAPTSFWDSTVFLARWAGADAAVASPDASLLGRAMTFVGNAQVDTGVLTTGGQQTLLCDGTGDYVTFANDSALSVATGDFTIEAWVYTTQAPGTKIQTITNKRDGAGAEEHSFFINTTGEVGASGFNSSAVVALAGTTILSTATWYHVAVSRVGSTWYLHLNGNLEDSDTQSGAPAANTGVFHIGRDGFNTGRDFVGSIGPVRMTKSVARYGAANFTPPARLELYE